tara:strand:+ start:43 stop:633 length:591 start_codon:yes stop_codon:yes gene_type:complete
MKFFKILCSLSLFLFFTAHSYGDNSEVPEKFKDWEVDKMGDIIRYSTYGEVIHGHRFGWLKTVGSCEHDNLYVTYSSTYGNINILGKLKKNNMPLKVIFPQEKGLSFQIFPEIIGLNGLGSLQIVTLSNFGKAEVMDAYLSKLNSIIIDIEDPYKSLFDVAFESWSLDGYIAAKLKAKELCDAETAKKNTVIAFNH